MATPILTFGQRQQALQGLPFYGKADFNFVASKSPFSNGIAIKILPLADLSRPQAVNTDEFEQEIHQLNQQFKMGSRISGVKINSTFRTKDREPDVIIGKFDGLKIDQDTQTIRAFIKDPKTLKRVEVYPETLNRLTESKSHLAKTFLEFVI
jgi:hypothetical protein